MFTVKIKDKPVEEFYACDKKPVTLLLDSVMWFKATDKELKIVKDQFNNIPISAPGFSECVWHGEMAQFIFRNLKIASYQK